MIDCYEARALHSFFFAYFFFTITWLTVEDESAHRHRGGSQTCTKARASASCSAATISTDSSFLSGVKKKNDGAMANNVFFVFYCLIFELLLIGTHSRHTEKGGGGRRGIVNHIKRGLRGVREAMSQYEEGGDVWSRGVKQRS